jgi:hypothetical protein
MLVQYVLVTAGALLSPATGNSTDIALGEWAVRTQLLCLLLGDDAAVNVQSG